MVKLKWYEVGVHAEKGYRLMVEAEDEKQAELLVEQLIDYAELPEPASWHDIVHREELVTDSREAKGYEPPAKLYGEVEKHLARLAFLLEEQVHGEFHLCHDPRALPELKQARELVLTALEFMGVDTKGDEISVINEGR